MRAKWSMVAAVVVVFAVVAFVALLPSEALLASDGGSVEKARLLHRHGLTSEAKAELIDVLFGASEDESKAEAHYLLGSISFGEGKVAVAVALWRTLVNEYPESLQATLVREDLDALAEIVEESADESIENAVANAYIRHGNFWSKGKRDRFTIDSSWISNVEAAVKWYDKVIEEFPDTDAARRAHEEKLRTLLGWETAGRFGTKHGIEESFDEYMPLLLEAFSAFEQSNPDASTLQAFRFQIAQAYWGNHDWDKTREWLNTIVSESEDRDEFYRDLAQRRLEKVEY